jgi:hypothetical protein
MLLVRTTIESSSNYGAVYLPMLLHLSLIHSHILPYTITLLQDATLAFRMVVVEFSFINVAIGISFLTSASHDSLYKCSLITTSIGPNHQSMAMHFVFMELAMIYLS